jgi:putative phosphoesterase
MRILLISDIHANFSALAALDEQYDICLCMGDLVEYGPEPTRVIEWVRNRANYCVRGNHDHGTAQNVEVTGSGGFRYLTMATRRHTIQMLNRADRQYLAELPTLQLVTIAKKRFLLVHATPRDPLDEYTPMDATSWATRVAGWNVDYVCVGHTHQQFVFDIAGTKVINPGSLGLQRDGNPKARYAILDDGKVELKEIDYDVEAVVAALEASPFEENAKRMLADVYRTGRYQHPIPGYSNNGNGVHKIERVSA